VTVDVRKLVLLSIAAAVLLLGVIGGCGGTSAPPLPTLRPPPTTSTSELQRALEAARQRLELLGDGQALPPLSVAWSDVESGTLLNRQQNAAFCTALDVPGADDALASLVFMGLEALSFRFRRKPLSRDVNDVVELAATFATKSCPGWAPVVNPPRRMATPIPLWHPAGYSIVFGDQDLVWRWSTNGSFACLDQVAWCWQIDVLSRYGCTRVDGVLHVHGDGGVVVDVEESAVADVPAGGVVPMQFGSDVPAPDTVQLRHLTCTR
jgi:hypothetical protein